MCDQGAFSARFTCVATYNNNAPQSILNYSLCVLTLATFVQQIGCKLCALALLLFYIVFQFALCMGIGCAGVSIIWAALLGAALTRVYQHRRTWRSSMAKWALLFVVAVVDLAAVIYYMAVAPPITTLAHVLALAMGAGTRLIVEEVPRWLCAKSPEQSSSTEGRTATGIDGYSVLGDPTS